MVPSGRSTAAKHPRPAPDTRLSRTSSRPGWRLPRGRRSYSRKDSNIASARDGMDVAGSLIASACVAREPMCRSGILCTRRERESLMATTDTTLPPTRDFSASNQASRPLICHRCPCSHLGQVSLVFVRVRGGMPCRDIFITMAYVQHYEGWEEVRTKKAPICSLV
eukprot:scaffold198080_cov35-Tisochrysis_lutea.AAC.1